MFRAAINRLVRALKGHVCERCGASPAKLVVDAVKTATKMDGRARTVTKTFAVKSCQWLCTECR